MKNNKLNVNSLISFGGGLIILSLAAKLLHYSWAEKFMVGAFVLEACLFFLMAFQKSSNVGSSNVNPSTGEVPVSHELSVKLENALISLTHSSDANMMVSQAIISDVGLDNLISKIEGLKKYNSINIDELQSVINDNVEKFKELGEVVDTLNRIHLAQINSFRHTK